MSTILPPKQQFILFAPSSGREPSFILFEGCEWPDLLQASHSIVRDYGRQFAIEICGRYFVLTFQEAFKIKKAEIPFQLGFYNDSDVNVLPFPGTGSRDYFKWLTEDEWNAATDWRVIEHADSREPVQGEQKKEFQSRKSGAIGPYIFQATIYNTPFPYGVREGNILKLDLQLATTNETVAFFDHEWVKLPDDENIHCIIDSLVYHYEASEVEDDELHGSQEYLVLRKQLKEFIDSTYPLANACDYEGDYDELCQLYPIWNGYMDLAVQAYDRAQEAFELQDDWAAYWNALHAMSSHAAACAALQHHDERMAHTHAI